MQVVSIPQSTERLGTDCRDKQYLAVILHIRKYVMAVSRNIYDVIAVPSSFSIYIRQYSNEYFLMIAAYRAVLILIFIKI